MKKTNLVIGIICLGIGVFSNQASAFSGWEASVTVTSDNVKSRLHFGQKPDATALTDGLYDLPAMLSGTLQGYFQNEDGSFWRDIRAMESEEEWQLIITSQTEKPIYITWDPALFPPDAKVRLIDASNAKETDMQSANTYMMGSASNTMLLITVTNK